MFTLKTVKVIGTPNGLAWSQVHEFMVEGEKLERRGRLLVVLTLKEAGEGIEAVAAGREVLARVNEEYYGNLEESPFGRLKGTLEKLNKEFGNLELLLVAFYQKVGYFGILGGGKVIVKRRSAVQTVLELKSNGKPGNTRLPSLARPPAEPGEAARGGEATGGQAETLNNTEILKISIGSGFIEEGDIFLLGSEKFFGVVAEGTWQAALGTGEPEEMVEILAPIVAGREKGGGLAVAAVKIVSEIEPRMEEVKPELTDIAPGVSQELPKSVGRFFSIRELFGKIIASRPIFVRRKVDQQKRRQTLLTVAVILILLLVSSVVLGIRKRSVEQKTAKFEKIIAQIEDKLEEGKGLSAIKPAGAKRIFEEALKSLNELSELKVQGSRFKVLREEIENELAKVVREFKLTEVPLFLDLSLVKEGARGNDLGLFGNNLVVLDKEGKRLIGIHLEKKSSKILAGGEDLEGASQVAIWDDRAYVLTERGILESPFQIPNSLPRRQAGKFQIPKDESWGQIIDLVAWTGNLYLLDKKHAVWRYLVIEGGFGGAQNWIKGSAPDLSKATSFAIDGSIWITQQSSSAPILKFTSGGQEEFSVVGLEKLLSSPLRIYTDDISHNIYILDKGNYRVVVLDKEGNYQASYLWAGIEDVDDMVVSEEKKKILLLAKNKIYEIGIR